MRQKDKDTVSLGNGITLRPNKKSPNLTYVATITVNGRNYNRGCSTSNLGEAIVKATELKAALEIELRGTTKPTIKIKQLIALHLDYLENDQDIPEKTLARYKSTYNRIIGQRIHNITGEVLYHDRKGNPMTAVVDENDSIHTITEASWDDWIALHQGKGKNRARLLSDSTINGVINRLAQLNDFAIDQDYEGSSADIRAAYKLMAAQKNKSRDFTEKDVHLLLKHFKNSRYEHNYYRLQTLLHTGLRLSEVCTLRRENISLADKTIKVVRLKKKQNDLVTIRMSDRLYNDLSKWWWATEKYNSEFLFCKPDGSMYRAQGQWLTEACKSLGINSTSGENIVCHSARARFITRQIQAGIPLPNIQLSVGHNGIKTTMGYSRLCPEEASNQAAEVMDSLADEQEELLKRLKEIERLKDME